MYIVLKRSQIGTRRTPARAKAPTRSIGSSNQLGHWGYSGDRKLFVTFVGCSENSTALGVRCKKLCLYSHQAIEEKCRVHGKGQPERGGKFVGSKVYKALEPNNELIRLRRK